MRKLSDYVFDFVAGQGVKHVFMLPGGGAMHLVDSLGRNRKLTYICNLHEQACAVAADACSQYTNNLGVALVTTGPGGTNTITGVAASWLDSIPVLFISGQVKRTDMIGGRGVRQMGFQEIDIVSLVRSVTKYAVTVTNPAEIRYHLEKAAYLARSGRPGPVWIDIPLDVQAAVIDERRLAAFRPERRPVRSLSRDAASVMAMINRSERPAILAGNGIRLSGALKPFRRLVDQLGIPVLTTWKMIDFLPEDHPLYAGRPGAVGQRGANFAQQNADLLLVIGARLDLGQTAYNHAHFAPAARKIMVDVDPYEIRKMDMTVALPIEGDAALFVQELLRQKGKVKRQDRGAWIARCKEWKNRYPVVLKEYWDEKRFVNDYVLIDILSEEMRADDLLIPGSSGACSERSMQAFRVREGMRIFNSEGLGPMGFGIPMAIGGCIASGKKRTVCIDGDGGFVMNIQELEVVRRLNLPIKFFVLNNQGYVSIQTTQKNYFRGNFVASTRESGLTLPDYRKVAKAFGIPSFQLKDHRDINKKVRAILNAQGPSVCEVMVSPDQMTAPRVSTRSMPDGSMVSAPMEDLWPLLDREELNSNMLLSQQER
ncbi:MAG: thiamine pyrophosphate-binding protein [Nitrospiraceae bacterium]|nr:thiamine pyrophosphate-binding protein [Nitrospiraceae bacterium]